MEDEMDDEFEWDDEATGQSPRAPHDACACTGGGNPSFDGDEEVSTLSDAETWGIIGGRLARLLAFHENLLRSDLQQYWLGEPQGPCYCSDARRAREDPSETTGIQKDAPPEFGTTASRAGGAHVPIARRDFVVEYVRELAGPDVADALERRLQQASGVELEIVRDLALALPWGNSARAAVSIPEASRCLDRWVVGQGDLKRELLGYVAAFAHSKGGGGRVLLVGSPGTGKTTIARGMAEALGRPCEFIALAGMLGAFGLKGSEAVYSNPAPGAIIRAYAAARDASCVIVLDEVDKLAQSNYNGSAADALLDIAEPTNARAFTDAYLSVPFDASRALYVATANSLEEIPPPLLDRFEVIRVPGYTIAEFEAIARLSAGPKAVADANFRPGEVTVDHSAWAYLAGLQEPGTGARHLVAQIDRVMREARLCLSWSGTVRVDAEFVRTALSGGHRVPEFLEASGARTPQGGGRSLPATRDFVVGEGEWADGNGACGN